MRKFQCSFYILNGRESLRYVEGNDRCPIKIADRPFPDSLLTFLYYDVNQWEPQFHEADRALIKYYETHDAACLRTVQKLLVKFKDEHPYFWYLWLDWSERIKQVMEEDCDPMELLPHKKLAHVPSNLDTMQRQILFLFQTVLNTEMGEMDFAARMRAYEKATSLHRFDFQPMTISFELMEGREFTEVLYPQSMYDIIEFSLRECLKRKIMMRICKNCGKYFALTVHGSTEYCSRVFDDRGRTCKDVGAMRQYMQTHAQDELLKIYRREYKRRFAWIRAGKIAPEDFSDWSETARREKARCEAGEISEDEFIKWLKR